YAKLSPIADFAPRHGLDRAELTELFLLDEAGFEEITRGSPLRRISHEQWLRNLAVALGNAPASAAVVGALEQRRDHPSAMVREHVGWAIAEQARRAASGAPGG
ncbi:MAG: tRNA epoxyqueuosine(34) reductase QueG, partial [Gammaproteobacteria bacterium]